MATHAKRPTAPKSAKDKTSLAARAVEALKDPRVIAQIVEHAPAAIDALKHWATSVVDNLEDRFGQKGLEKREAKLRAAVTALSKQSPSLATALRPVLESLDEVGRLLMVSDALPFAKRKKAHMRIDDILDELEKGLLDATARRDP